MSRIKERIPIILDNINWLDFITYLGFDNPQDIADKCIKEQEDIREVWLKYPDLRLIQLLVIGGILENKTGSWFYLEENNYMIEKKILKLEYI